MPNHTPDPARLRQLAHRQREHAAVLAASQHMRDPSDTTGAAGCARGIVAAHESADALDLLALIVETCAREDVEIVIDPSTARECDEPPVAWYWRASDGTTLLASGLSSSLAEAVQQLDAAIRAHQEATPTTEAPDA